MSMYPPYPAGTTLIVRRKGIGLDAALHAVTVVRESPKGHLMTVRDNTSGGRFFVHKKEVIAAVPTP